MVTGRLRTVLWILGTLGVLSPILWLSAFTAMGMDGMMAGMGGAGPGGMMGGEGMMGGLSVQAGAMIGGMLAQTLGTLGLIGIFIYLVVETLRATPRSADPHGG